MRYPGVIEVVAERLVPHGLVEAQSGKLGPQFHRRRTLLARFVFGCLHQHTPAPGAARHRKHRHTLRLRHTVLADPKSSRTDRAFVVVWLRRPGNQVNALVFESLELAFLCNAQLLDEPRAANLEAFLHLGTIGHCARKHLDLHG